jgi:hypothetical protein
MTAMDLGDQARRAKKDAVQWIFRHLDYYNPLLRQSAMRFKFALKASAELALQCALVMKSSGDPSFAEMASFIWSDVFSAPAVQEYLLERGDLLAFGFYASLRLCGYEDLEYRARLEGLLEEGYPAMVERAPSRELDLIYSLRKSELPLRGLSSRAAYSKTLLAKHPPLYPLTDQDAYAITHTVFFLTDFGQAPNGMFTSEDDAYFALALPRLLEYYLHKRDWDLSGELLIAMRGVALDRLPLFHQAWSVLLAAQEEDGSFAGPAPSDLEADEPHEAGGSTARGDDDREQRWRRFHDNYHTTLVALLGLHLSLASERSRGP